MLHDDGARCHAVAMTNVANLELDQIASPQLTVESQVEHSQFPDSMFELQSHPDSPDILQLEWRLLAHQFALVPRFVVGLVARFFHDEFLVVERNSTLLRFDCDRQSDCQLRSRQSEGSDRCQE